MSLFNNSKTIHEEIQFFSITITAKQYSLLTIFFNINETIFFSITVKQYTRRYRGEGKGRGEGASPFVKMLNFVPTIN